jgi:hypothetical protein
VHTRFYFFFTTRSLKKKDKELASLCTLYLRKL